jgi:murein DD-endopeptidase MepM/ murein hydrolase activator NlpD
MCDAHDPVDDHGAIAARRFGGLTRRRAIATLAVGAVGAVVAGRSMATASGATARLSEPGTALQPAERIGVQRPVVTPAPPGKIIFPVDPGDDCYILDNFGDSRGGGTRLHEGVDIMGSRYRAVLAVAAGRLVKRYTNTGTAGWGWTLHDDANDIYYKYFHLSADEVGLREGQRVAFGAVLGYVGKSGTFGVDNYHLHFEMRPGNVPIDPLPRIHVDNECGISPPIRA